MRRIIYNNNIYLIHTDTHACTHYTIDSRCTLLDRNEKYITRFCERNIRSSLSVYLIMSELYHHHHHSLVHPSHSTPLHCIPSHFEFWFEWRKFAKNRDRDSDRRTDRHGMEHCYDYCENNEKREQKGKKKESTAAVFCYWAHLSNRYIFTHAHTHMHVDKFNIFPSSHNHPTVIGCIFINVSTYFTHNALHENYVELNCGGSLNTVCVFQIAYSIRTSYAGIYGCRYRRCRHDIIEMRWTD